MRSANCRLRDTMLLVELLGETCLELLPTQTARELAAMLVHECRKHWSEPDTSIILPPLVPVVPGRRKGRAR